MEGAQTHKETFFHFVSKNHSFEFAAGPGLQDLRNTKNQTQAPCLGRNGHLLTFNLLTAVCKDFLLYL